MEILTHVHLFVLRFAQKFNRLFEEISSEGPLGWILRKNLITNLEASRWIYEANLWF